MVLRLVTALLLAWGAPIAPTAPPPAPDGDTFWTTLERPVRLRLLTPAAGRTGQAIFLMAALPLEQSCEYGAGITWVLDPSAPARPPPAGPPQAFRGHVWRRHGVPCDPVVRIVEHPIHVETRSPGTYRFVSGEGAIITVKVSGRAPKFPDQSAARRCRFDEACWVTDVCVPSKRGAAELGICAEICGDDLDCGSRRCDRRRGIVGVCAEGSYVACDARHPCGLGQICKDRRCEWPSPPRERRHDECETDRTCAPDLFCVKPDAAGAAHGRCEMLCGAGLPPCPDHHECNGQGTCRYIPE
ncbi:MAG TPA: hypothetical protein VN903_40440 [Polyangia bacterium]|nr:hypothetical protein [Polyangia bacterium]